MLPSLANSATMSAALVPAKPTAFFRSKRTSDRVDRVLALVVFCSRWRLSSMARAARLGQEHLFTPVGQLLPSAHLDAPHTVLPRSELPKMSATVSQACTMMTLSALAPVTYEMPAPFSLEANTSANCVVLNWSSGSLEANFSTGAALSTSGEAKTASGTRGLNTSMGSVTSFWTRPKHGLALVSLARSMEAGRSAGQANCSTTRVLLADTEFGMKPRPNFTTPPRARANSGATRLYTGGSASSMGCTTPLSTIRTSITDSSSPLTSLLNWSPTTMLTLKARTIVVFRYSVLVLASVCTSNVVFGRRQLLRQFLGAPG